jgi:oligopeptide transport system ATP-binding protein
LSSSPADTANRHDPILRVEGLAKHYPMVGGALRRRSTETLRALDGVSFELERGTTLAIVGESGCGKSTLALTLARLLEPTAGRAFFDGSDIAAMRGDELRAFRRQVQIVFQDPFESLNPTMTVAQIVSEPFAIHKGTVPRGEWRTRVSELLELVGLRRDQIDRLPSQFSGGQRQRIGIARAIALNPAMLICDEPVSALDVSVQAQVINLLQDIQERLGLTYIFISHDLGVVRHIADHVAVMYLGRIVEYGSVDDVFERAQHPYTRALVSSAPAARFAVDRPERILLSGEVPSPTRIPVGCSFATRCWQATDLCREVEPVLAAPTAAGHVSACHYPRLVAETDQQIVDVPQPTSNGEL